MVDWDSLSGSALSTALSGLLSHLVASERDRQLLNTVTFHAEHATQEGDHLKVTFAGGYILTSQPQTDEDASLITEWPVASRVAANLTLEFSRAGHEGLSLCPDILDLDDYDLDPPFEDCPTTLLVALRDFSDWWVFVSQPEGPPALTRVDHGGNFDAPVELSLGGLFLSRMAEVLGDGSVRETQPEPESRTGDVVRRCLVSTMFADDWTKHIKAITNHGDFFCLVGLNGVVNVDAHQPWRVMGHIEFDPLSNRGHVNAVCRGDELFVGHSDGSLRVNVGAPTSPQLLARHDISDDRRDFSTMVASFEYVHYYLTNPTGRSSSWYAGPWGANLEKFADEDDQVVSAVLLADRLFVASQENLTRFDVSKPCTPKLELRTALNGFWPRLVARPDLGLLLVIDNEPAHALRVVSLDSLRARSSSWNVFKLKGRQTVVAWQLHDDRIDLLIGGEEPLLLVTVSLSPDSPPAVRRAMLVELPRGRRVWEPCMVQVEPDRLGILFRDGEWIEWQL